MTSFRQPGGRLALAAAAAAAAMLALPAQAADRFIIVQSTTSTQNSGLYGAILPVFEAATGIEARVVAVGTGQALKNARNCDGDVLLVHAKAAEETFVAEGYGVERFDVMYNDFVLIGPASDPAGVGATQNVAEAFQAIAAAQAPFASRGDDSGTHKKETALWTLAGVDPTAESGEWYRETGSGMGATLNIASGMGAYALTDRGTWIAFENKADLDIVTQGYDELFNPYGVIAVNPTHCPSVKAEEAQAFVDWITSEEGQSLIAAYQRGGQQLFFPSAKPR